MKDKIEIRTKTSKILDDTISIKPILNKKPSTEELMLMIQHELHKGSQLSRKQILIYITTGVSISIILTLLIYYVNK